MSSDAIYAIGPRQAKPVTGFAVDEPAQTGAGAPAHLQVSPTELVLTPGQTVKLRVRLFDDKGRFLKEETGATWTLDGLKGTAANNSVTVAPDPVEQAGSITATVGALKGSARARVVRPLPWKEGFDSYADAAVPPGWVNTTGAQLAVTTVDGQKVLREEAARDALQARPHLHRPHHLVELHDGSRRPDADAAAAAGRRRHHGPALFAGALRQRAAAQARAVGAGDDTDDVGPVRVEAGYVVSVEAARGEPGERTGPRARQGMASRRSRTGQRG